jgi:hypothetical protein
MLKIIGKRDSHRIKIRCSTDSEGIFPFLQSEFIYVTQHIVTELKCQTSVEVKDRTTTTQAMSIAAAKTASPPTLTRSLYISLM